MAKINQYAFLLSTEIIEWYKDYYKVDGAEAMSCIGELRHLKGRERETGPLTIDSNRGDNPDWVETFFDDNPQLGESKYIVAEPDVFL
jgi:hypothetical protein